MKKLLFIIWLCLAICGMVSQCAAQESPKAIQFFWVTEDKVYLWTSDTEANPLTATYDQSKKNWNLSPNEETDNWLKIFEDAARQYYSELPVDQYVREGKLKNLMLAKLRNEYPSPKWALAGVPVAEIFIH